MIMTLFTVGEACNDKEYMIRLDSTSLFYGGDFAGSYNVIGARILGLSYVDYLRYLRDEFGAEIRGKQGYSYPIFKSKDECNQAVKKLNSFAEPLLKELRKYE